MAIDHFCAELARKAPQYVRGSGALSTEEVNRLAMTHLVGERRCAFVALLDTAGEELVGEATVFVSHAWGMPFDTLVAALRESERELREREPARKPYFWVDALVKDLFEEQEQGPMRPFEWWAMTIRSNVQRIGHTVVVLEWERQLPLERIWCVWELFCAIEGKDGRLELALPPASGVAFVQALVDDFGSIAAKLCRIDLSNARSYNAYDTANIRGAIESTPGGFDRVSKVVISLLRDWMVRTGLSELASIKDHDERAGSALQNSLATLLQDFGRLSEAEPLFRESLEVRRRTLGGTHPSALVSIYNLGSLLRDRGDLDSAEPLLREALDGCRRTLGDAHPSTLTSIASLGRLLQARGDLDGAEPLYREALDVCRRTLGDAHPSTLTSINNLCSLLLDRSDLGGAEPLYREALDSCRRTLGDTHPSTLNSINNLSALLKDCGDLDSAEPLLRECLVLRRRTLGDAHPNTLVSINSLGRLLHARGDLDSAEPLLREALAESRGTLGDTHPSTLAYISSLGELLQDRSDLDGAELLLREALTVSRRILGETHPDTSSRFSRLGRLLFQRDKPAEAEAFLQKAFTADVQRFGLRHAKTLRSMADLVQALERSGRDRREEARLRAELEDLVADHASADLILGRFRFSVNEPLHVSLTSFVIEGTDERDPTQKRPVALKFLRDRAQFNSEVEARRQLGAGASAVVDFVRDGVFGPEAFGAIDRERINERLCLVRSGVRSFTKDSTFLLVMPLCSKSLLAVIETESEQDDWAARARDAFKQAAEALGQLHERGLIHGDVKPRNVLRVRPERHARFVLIDLDAARPCDGDAAGSIGPKISTGYAPPEALSARPPEPLAVHGAGAAQQPAAAATAPALGCAACRGTLSPPLQWCGRGGGSALRASRAFDMWGLGGTLFHMLARRPLLPVNKDDNLTEESVDDKALESRLFRWSKKDLREKLGFVPGRALAEGAGDLLEKLLCARPEERITVAGVLKHPYVTGYKYDVFISYRRYSELSLARDLRDMLQGRTLSVFLDEREIPLGGDFREEFCGSIALSRVFLPLISRAAVDVPPAPLASGPRPPAGPWCELTAAASPIDNVLLEHRVAFELMGRDRSRNASTGGAAAAFAGPPSRLQNVCPVFIGPAVETIGPHGPEVSRGPYWAAPPRAPPAGVVVEAVEHEMREILQRLGLEQPAGASPCTAADVWTWSSALANGVTLSDADGVSMGTLVDKIAGVASAARSHSGARAAPSGEGAGATCAACRRTARS